MAPCDGRRAVDEARHVQLFRQDLLGRVLPFPNAHAVQQPDGHVEKAKRPVDRKLLVACSVRLGGSKEEAAKIRLPHDDSWEYTLLGSQNAWIEQISVPQHLEKFREKGNHRVQVYRGEDVCINGSTRTTVVVYECGAREEIVRFRVRTGCLAHRQENGMCNYEMLVRLPAACSQSEADRLQAAIQSVASFSLH